jgi:hypothetical protein
VAGDPPGQGPAGPLDGRLGAAVRYRLDALHELAPGLAARPQLVRVAFLMAASSPAERETAAQAHEAQAAQLRGPLPAALGRAFLALQPLWHGARRRLGPGATVAELLALADRLDPELAAGVREDLTGAGLDPDQLGWPPDVG